MDLNSSLSSLAWGLSGASYGAAAFTLSAPLSRARETSADSSEL
jgi:hypothetical protein